MNRRTQEQQTVTETNTRTEQTKNLSGTDETNQKSRKRCGGEYQDYKIKQELTDKKTQNYDKLQMNLH